MEILNKFSLLAAAAVIAAAIAINPAHAADMKNGESDDTSVGTELSEAAQAIKNYTVEQRDAALREAEEMMASLDRQIEEQQREFNEGWDDLTTEAREQTMELRWEMQQQRNELAEWYGGMKHSTAEAWDDVTTGFANAYDDIQSSWSDTSETDDGGSNS